MGVGIFKCSTCNCTKPSFIVSAIKRVFSYGNPDPREYEIVKIEFYKEFCIAMINYPDCKNYEGNKVLIFKNVTENMLRQTNFIDPHFCKGNHISPIARFEPSEEGIKLARIAIEAWIKERKQ